jgi:hypothetical protein
MICAQANPPAKAVARPQSSAPRVAIAPYDGDRKGAAGLGRDARFAVVSAVHAAAPLSGDRQVMLDNLLGEWGARLFPGTPATSDAARQAILEVGQLPAGPDGLRTAGSHYFRTAGGAVLIDDARARFIPASGGKELRVDGNVVLSGEYGVRCNAWIARELDRLRTSLGNSFSATQASALGAWLGEQRLRLHDDDRIFYSRSRGTTWEGKARMSGDTLEYASIQILPEGRIIDLSSVEQQQASIVMPAAKPVSGPSLEPSAGNMLEGLGVVDISVSGFLLACGIGIFVQWRRAANAHWWYVWFKFAMIVIGIILIKSFLTELEATPVAQGNKAAAAQTAAISRASIVGGFIGEMLYPLAILLMVRTKSARDYFAELTGNEPSSPGQSAAGVARLDHPKVQIVAVLLAAITVVAGLVYWLFAGGTNAGEEANWLWLIACAATAAIWITAAIWPAKVREA